MTWWCVADGRPWEWAWRPYPGVWLACLGTIVLFVRARRGRSSRNTAWFAAGVACLWVAADWPIGALAAGYLVSVHAVQYLMIGLVAPLALALGLRDEAAPSAHEHLGHPLWRFGVFNGILILTHWPTVVDQLMRYQLGSFALDLLWVVGGLSFWSPVVGCGGARPLPAPAQMLYLFAAMLLPTVPAAFLTFARYPVYGLYELAPRIAGLSAQTDQRIAGLVMKVGCDGLLWIAMTVVFFRWASREGGPTRAWGIPT